jgi:hypothetical protein
MTILRMQECEQLNDYLKSRGLDGSWWDNVKAGKQDPWDRLRENDVNDQMRQFQIRMQ